jgi:hypothetical protein
MSNNILSLQEQKQENRSDDDKILELDNEWIPEEDDWYRHLDSTLPETKNPESNISRNNSNQNLSLLDQESDEEPDEIEQTINIQEIIELNLTNQEKINCENFIKSYLLIKYQYLVANYADCLLHGSSNSIKSNFSNTTEDQKIKIDYLITLLTWLSKVSGILAMRIDQKIVPYEITPPKIIRSSYTFCTESHSCKLYYNQSSAICSNHHFVHNTLKYNIDSIIHFLNYDNRKYKLTFADMQNICTSAKTISFVTNHMHRELYHVDYFSKGNSEKCHRPVNPCFQPKSPLHINVRDNSGYRPKRYTHSNPNSNQSRYNQCQ